MQRNVSCRMPFISLPILLFLINLPFLLHARGIGHLAKEDLSDRLRECCTNMSPDPGDCPREIYIFNEESSYRREGKDFIVTNAYEISCREGRNGFSKDEIRSTEEPLFGEILIRRGKILNLGCFEEFCLDLGDYCIENRWKRAFIVKCEEGTPVSSTPLARLFPPEKGRANPASSREVPSKEVASIIRSVEGEGGAVPAPPPVPARDGDEAPRSSTIPEERYEEEIFAPLEPITVEEDSLETTPEGVEEGQGKSAPHERVYISMNEPPPSPSPLPAPASKDAGEGGLLSLNLSELVKRLPMVSSKRGMEGISPDRKKESFKKTEEGNEAMLRMDYEGAAKKYLVALLLNPWNAYAFHDLGLLFLKIERFDHALFLFERALEIDPSHYGAHYNSGRSYESKGDLTRALISYQNVLRVNPEHIKAKLALNNLLEKMKGKGDIGGLGDRRCPACNRLMEKDYIFCPFDGTRVNGRKY